MDGLGLSQSSRTICLEKDDTLAYLNHLGERRRRWDVNFTHCWVAFKYNLNPPLYHRCVLVLSQMAVELATNWLWVKVEGL